MASLLVQVHSHDVGEETQDLLASDLTRRSCGSFSSVILAETLSFAISLDAFTIRTMLRVSRFDVSFGCAHTACYKLDKAFMARVAQNWHGLNIRV
jgi:hypothetical protein